MFRLQKSGGPYIYSAAELRLRGALWPIFAPALIYRWFVQRVIAEGIEPAKEFPAGPFPNETLTYRDKRTVEFVTPPYTYGTGTDSSLMPTANPIEGVVLLHGQDLDAIQLSVRLPAQSRELAKPRHTSYADLYPLETFRKQVLCQNDPWSRRRSIPNVEPLYTKTRNCR